MTSDIVTFAYYKFIVPVDLLLYLVYTACSTGNSETRRTTWYSTVMIHLCQYVVTETGVLQCPTLQVGLLRTPVLHIHTQYSTPLLSHKNAWRNLR